MKGITLPCYWHTEESKALRDMGVSTSSEMFEIKHITFYQIQEIDMLIPVEMDGKECCYLIFIGEEDGYTVDLTCKQVDKIIRDY